MRNHNKNKWTIPEQGVFLKKIGELLSRGYPLAMAIDSVAYQMNEKRHGDIQACLAQLKEGHPFYEILEKLQFHETLIGFVYFAEQHGFLASAFQEGGEYILKRHNDMMKLKKLFVYPAFLVGFTILIFFYMQQVLLPKYFSIFHTLNLSPSFFMKLISFFGQVLPFMFYGCFFFGLCLFGYYYWKFQSYCPQKQREILASIPIVGPFIRLLSTHYFSVQLSYLLKGGLSIMEACIIFENHPEERLEHHLGKDLSEKLKAGEKLEEIVKEYSFFEKEFPHIMKHGQENGKLAEELKFFSQHCFQEMEMRMEKFMKRLQPVLYGFIGLIIVIMYLAILMPMFQLLEGV